MKCEILSGISASMYSGNFHSSQRGKKYKFIANDTFQTFFMNTIFEIKNHPFNNMIYKQKFSVS